MHSASGVYVIGAGVYLYMCVCVCVRIMTTQKSLNGTLAVESSFQTLAVDLWLIYRLALQLRAPETLSWLSKSRISLFNAHLALFVRRMTYLVRAWPASLPMLGIMVAESTSVRIAI